MPNARILWVDDEIDLLKAHIMFLKEKGFDMESASNGIDALEMIQEKIQQIESRVSKLEGD